jgi:hypothetical protein
VNDFVNTTIPIHVELPSRLQSSNGIRAYNDFFTNQHSPLSDYYPSVNTNTGGCGVDSFTTVRSRNVSIDNPLQKQALPDASLSERLFEHIDKNKDGVVTFSDILLLPFSNHSSNEVNIIYI